MQGKNRSEVGRIKSAASNVVARLQKLGSKDKEHSVKDWEGLESLEPRVLLSADPAASVVAQFHGSVDNAGERDVLELTLSSDDFVFNEKNEDAIFKRKKDELLLTFRAKAEDGSGFDPAAIEIYQVKNGRPVDPFYLKSDIGADSDSGDSIAIFKLRAGSYTIEVAGEAGTTGAYALDIGLTGDVDGDRDVDMGDLAAFRNPDSTGLDRDVNLDGRAGFVDWLFTALNRDSSSSLDPLQLNLQLEPAPSGSLPDGSLRVTSSVTAVTGIAAPGLTVELDLDNDGTIDATTIAGEDGSFRFDLTLELGRTDLTVSTVDAFGQNPSTSIAITYEDAVAETDAPFITLNLANDNGSSAVDLLTNDPTVVGIVADVSDITALVAGLNGTLPENFVDVLATLQPDGSFELSTALLESINGGPLADGPHTLEIIATDAAGNVSDPTALIFTLDTLAPSVLEAPAGNFDFTFDEIELLFSEAMSTSAFAAAGYSLVHNGGVKNGQSVPISYVENLGGNRVRINVAGLLESGSYRVDFSAATTDQAGNAVDAATDIVFSVAAPVTVTGISPVDGEEMVSLTRETIVRFSAPVDSATVTTDSLYLIANGERIAGRIIVASNEQIATFFYDDPLPAATEVRVVVDGDQITGRDGLLLDADGDGQPGGMAKADFRTLPLTRIANTNVFGFVRDSSTGNPLEGVTIRVDAFPGAEVLTDINGRFELVNMPAPEFFVHIDGSTASAPTGFVYPNVGKPFHSVPGQTVQIEMDGTAFDIFLPPMAIADIQELSATETTEVGFGAVGKAQLVAMFPDLDPALFDQMGVTFAPGAAFDEFGNPATQATIIPVPPDRIPAPLPPNLNPSLVVSIQAVGATNFDVPAQVAFPNLDGLAPGEQTIIMSFDHDAGIWRNIGTATVSADGLSVVSDPGSGIVAPGWHISQPGVGGDDTPPDDPWEDAEKQQDANEESSNAAALEALEIAALAALELVPGPFGATVAAIQAARGIYDDCWDNYSLSDCLGSAVGGTGSVLSSFLGLKAAWKGTQVVIKNAKFELADTIAGWAGDANTLLGIGEALKDASDYADAANRSAQAHAEEQAAADEAMQEELQRASEELQQRIKDAVEQTREMFDKAQDEIDAAEEAVDAVADVVDEIDIKIIDEIGEDAPPDTDVGDIIQTIIDEIAQDERGGPSYRFPSPSPFDIGDTISAAYDLGLSQDDAVRFSSAIGSLNDVDVFKVSATAGNALSIELARDRNELVVAHIRVFDSIGNELISDSGSGKSSTPGIQNFVIEANGDYFVGVSSYGNEAYDPNVLGSAADGLFSGAYELSVELRASEISVADQILRSYDLFSGETRFSDTGVGSGTPQEFELAVQGAVDSFNNDFRPLTTMPAMGPLNLSFTPVDGGPTLNFKVNGSMSDVILAPDTDYTVTIFSPHSGFASEVELSTGRSGSRFSLGDVILGNAEIVDTDGDGLLDTAEKAIGTAPNLADTDGDGIDDGTEIEQGLDPLDGRAFPTGVISNLPLFGQAKSIILDGSILDAEQGQTAYVATGTHGLAVVDATQFNQPIVLGQLDLEGDATDVSVDSRAGIAVVASNNGGLHFVNVADRMEPTLIRTVAADAEQVEITNGIAYAAIGGELRSFDLQTGEELERISLGGSDIKGLARESSFLYAMDASRNLTVVGLEGVLMRVRGSVQMLDGAGKLTVGGGIAYAAARASDFRGGYATADVSDPDNPLSISASDVASPFVAPGTALAVNGSGLGVLVGASGVNSLDLMDVSDPQLTNQFVTRFALPSAPQDVAIGAGVAFVAGGSGGLSVVNYLSFDNLGVAPTADIELDVVDADPVADGIQVVEGSAVGVKALVTDDFQVRNVEFIVNGEVVDNDVSFPFDIVALAPTLAERSQMTVQIRAIDTGGNETLSEVITLNVVPDIIAPEITGITPADGDVRGTIFPTVRVEFSEAMDEATLTNANIQVAPVDDLANPLTPTEVVVRANGSSLQLRFDQLVAGDYRLLIDSPALTDLAGNPIAGAPVEVTFEVVEVTSQWVGGGATAAWNDAGNWTDGRAPGQDDQVLIDSEVPVTVTGNIHVGNLTLLSDLIINPNSTLTVHGGMTLEGDVSLRDTSGTTTGSISSLVFDGTQALDGTGRVLFTGSQNNFNGNIVSATAGSVLTVGSGITINNEIGSGTIGAASAGTIKFLGTIQTVTGNGYSIQLAGEFDNEGGTMTVNAGPGLVRLVNASLRNMTVAGDGELSGSSSTAAFENVQLDTDVILSSTDVAMSGGVTLNGDFDIGANSAVTVQGGLTLNGKVMLRDTSGTTEGSIASLVFEGTQALDGTGRVLFTGSQNNFNGNIVSATAGSVLTVGSGITVNNEIGSGTIGAASAGTIKFLGTIQTVTGNGYSIQLAGEFDNEGGTMTVNAGPGLVRLVNASLRNMTVAGDGELSGSSSTAAFENVQLDTDVILSSTDVAMSGGVTLNGDFDIGANSAVTVQGGLTLNGKVMLRDTSGTTEGSIASLVFEGTQALDGTGRIVFTGSQNNFNGNIVSATAGSVLTVGSGITINNEIGSGTIGAASAGTIKFLGTIQTVTGNGYSIQLAGEFDNEGGTMTVNAGPGFVRLVDASIRNATIVGSGLLSSTSSGDTLFDNVELGVDLDIEANTVITAINGMTLNGDVMLRDTSGTTTGAIASLVFEGTQALDGTGRIVFTGSQNNFNGNIVSATAGSVLTVGSGITVNNEIGSGTIGAASAGTIKFLGTIQTVTGSGYSIQLAGEFDNEGGTMTVNAGPGFVRLVDASIRNATIVGSGLLSSTSSGDTLFDNVELGVDLDIEANTVITAINGMTLNGDVMLRDTSGTTTGAIASLVFEGTQALDGTGRIVFTGSQNNFNGNIVSATAGSVLTVGSGITVNNEIGSGTIGAASAGTIKFLGTIQTVTGSGYSIQLAGEFDNEGGTMTVNAGPGFVRLVDASIRNATIVGSGLLSSTSSGDTLFDNVELGVDLDIEANTVITAINGMTLNGDVMLRDTSGTTTGAIASLVFEGTQALDGTGRIVFTGSQNNFNGNIVSATAGSVLTVGSGITVNNEIGSGTIGAASAGTIKFLGTIQTVTGSGYSIQLAGEFDNEGGTMTVNAGPGFVRLVGATLRNVTLAGTEVLEATSSNNKVDNVQIDGTLNLIANSIMTVTNGLTINGELLLSDTSGSTEGSIAGLVFEGDQLLDGTGTVRFAANTSSTTANSIEVLLDETLTIGSDLTVSGGGGSIIGAGTVVNTGTVVADVTSRALLIQAANFINQGTLGADNRGLLQLYNLAPNAGTILAGDGGLVTINGDFESIATGTVEVEIGGTSTSQYGRINVTGAGTLAGTLSVSLVNDFTPLVGNRFDFITFGSRTGAFSTLFGLDIGGGLALNLDSSDPLALDLVTVSV